MRSRDTGHAGARTSHDLRDVMSRHQVEDSPTRMNVWRASRLTEERIDRVVRRTSIRKKQALTGPDSCGRVRQSMIQPINTARQPRLNLRFGGYGMRRLIETLGVLMVSSLPYAQMGSVVGSVMDESEAWCRVRAWP